VTDLAAKVDPAIADIRLDGKAVRDDTPRVYIALNKPVGYVTTVKDPHAERTVMDLVTGACARLYPVGRLDADTSGLLLLTNDGDFAQQVAHPSHGVEKTYRATVRGDVYAEAEVRLRTGVRLKDGRTAPAKLRVLGRGPKPGETSLEVTIHEGRNRQVRRMLDAVGCPVLTLTRTAVGPITLRGMEPGTWRALRPQEVEDLLAAASESSERQTEPPEPITEPHLGDPRRMTEDEIRAAARELAERLGRDTAEERDQSDMPRQPRRKGSPRPGSGGKR
jgi:23S rRNA pseudouridine2605 synthase